MKLTVNRDILSKSLRRCDLKAAPTGNPALASVALSARNVPDLPGGLDLRATNGLLGVASMVACNTEREGDVFINTKQLATVVNMMPLGTLTLESRGEDLVVTSGERRWRGKTLPLTHVKALPELPETATLKLPAEELARAIDRVRFAVSNAGAEHTARQGVLLDLLDGALSSVVIGDHMIAISRGQEKLAGTWRGFLPEITLPLAHDIALEEEKGTIELFCDEHYTWLQNSSTLLVYNPPPGEFIDWRFQLSKLKPTPICRLPRLAVLESLKALIAACPEEFARTWVQVKSDGTLLLDYSSSSGDIAFHDSITVTDLTETPCPAFIINAEYLRDALDAAGGDAILNHDDYRHASLTTEDGFLWTCA
ncbi:MAG TPA: hypothetical protein VGB13_04515, partial [Candidatus Krumholzibacteria bacterium]